MGNIYVGIDKLKNLYVGTSKVKKIYKDTTMIWQSAIPIARPTSAQLNPSGTYSGSSISNGFSMTGVEYVRGDASGTNVGVYTAYYRPDAEHIWEDTEDRAEVAVVLTVNKLKLTIPSLSNHTGKTYNGSSQSVTVNNFNSTWETQSGNASATNAGSYTVTWSLRDTSNTAWTDDTTVAKSQSWSIAKAAGILTLSASSLSVGTRKTGSFNINSNHGGTLSVSSSATGKATVSRSGTTVTVSGVAVGSATITVTCAATTNYNAASATVSVSVYQSTFTVTVHGITDYEDQETHYDHYFSGNYYTYWGDVIAIGGYIYSNNSPWCGGGYGYLQARLTRYDGNNSYIYKEFPAVSSYGGGFVKYNNRYLRYDDAIIDGGYYTSDTLWA